MTTLREMPGHVVHCKTKDEFDRLMRLYEAAGWKYASGSRPTTVTWESREVIEGKGRVHVRAYHPILTCSDAEDRRVVTVDQFLVAQGLAPLIEVGKKYRPKAGQKSGCGNFNKCKEAAYIVPTLPLRKSGKLDDYYIYRADGEKAGKCCICFSPNDLEPYEEPEQKPLRPEDLKAGDWIEVTKRHVRGVDSVFDVGERYRVTRDGFSEMGSVLVDTSCRGFGHDAKGTVPGQNYWIDGDKVRKCPPPDGTKKDAKTGSIASSPKGTLSVNGGEPVPLERLSLAFPAAADYEPGADIKPEMNFTIELSPMRADPEFLQKLSRVVGDDRQWRARVLTDGRISFSRPHTNQPNCKSPASGNQPPSSTAPAGDTPSISSPPSPTMSKWSHIKIGERYRVVDPDGFILVSQSIGRGRHAYVVPTWFDADGDLHINIFDAKDAKIDWGYCQWPDAIAPLLRSSNSPLPPLLMKAYDAGKDVIDYLRLGADEKLLRECGYKDSAGQWTKQAEEIFIAELLRKDGEKVLLPLAREIKEAADKAKKSCK